MSAFLLGRTRSFSSFFLVTRRRLRSVSFLLLSLSRVIIGFLWKSFFSFLRLLFSLGLQLMTIILVVARLPRLGKGFAGMRFVECPSRRLSLFIVTVELFVLFELRRSLVCLGFLVVVVLFFLGSSGRNRLVSLSSFSFSFFLLGLGLGRRNRRRIGERKVLHSWSGGFFYFGRIHC
jgi:hypothetical protein